MKEQVTQHVSDIYSAEYPRYRNYNWKKLSPRGTPSQGVVWHANVAGAEESLLIPLAFPALLQSSGCKKENNQIKCLIIKIFI